MKFVNDNAKNTLNSITKKILIISFVFITGGNLFAQEYGLNESFADIIEERTTEPVNTEEGIINPAYPLPVAEQPQEESSAEQQQEVVEETAKNTETAENTETAKNIVTAENTETVEEETVVNVADAVIEVEQIEEQQQTDTEDQPEINPVNLVNEGTTQTEDFPETQEVSPEQEIEKSLGGIGEVPAAKRPKPMDQEKANKAAEKDETKEDYENRLNTIRYGLPSEIGELIDKIIENDDPRYSEEIYDLFQTTSNASIKEKILRYFTKIEDPCLEDFAVNLLNDPYDEKKDVVAAAFKYIQKIQTQEAIPPVITLLESENEEYFNDALATIGDLGSKREAKFIAEYLQRDDLTDAQRQTLMRTLGKMKAENCWSQIVDILEDEDENTFVRMYAAEAIGAMEKKESVPILVRNYSASDPNLRQYVIKGLAYFPDVLEAKSTIIQAIRDEHWKVRQEAINICKEKEFTDSIQYLIYRAKNDSEKVIKNASYDAIAKLNVQEGNDFLVGQVTDKKVGDTTKQKAIEVLLKEGNAGEKEILELAESIIDDDKRKSFRYAVGKELAKNAKPQYEDICSKFLASKDTTTISLGLDMYKNCKYPALEGQMRAIAMDKKANSSIKNRIKKMLDIKDEEETSEKKEDKPDAK